MRKLACTLVACAAVSIWTSPVRAQEPRQVALVYELDLPPLFAPNGEPEETADFHVDTLLRHVRSLEAEHGDGTFAIAIEGVACDELALIDTDPARRTLATLRRLARGHVVLKTLHTKARLEHLTSRRLKDEVERGVRSVERCTGVTPRDPLIPPGLVIATEQAASDLRDAGVKAALSASAVPPGERRPRVLPALALGRSDTEDVLAARLEAPELVVVVPMERQAFLSEATDEDTLDVVGLPSLRDVDVIGGVIAEPFDVPASYVTAVAGAELSVDRFRSYVLRDNPLLPIYETVVARAHSTARWKRKNIDQAAARAKTLSATITAAERAITAPEGAVTFTARRGSVPITVANRAPYPVRVRVELSSSKLDFGSSRGRLVTPVTTVDPPGETITFQAVARSSGTFPVDVVVRTPDGLVLDRAEVTVRSAAANLSAVVLTAGGAGFLVYWLIRRRRPPTEAAS